MLERQQFVWTVDLATLQEMKKAKVNDEFYSPDFDYGDLTWSLEACPNGWNDDSEGFFIVFLALQTRSEYSTWKFVDSCFQIRCNETQHSAVMQKRIGPLEENKLFQWPNGTLSFSEIQSLNSLTFSVDIFIRKIILNNGDMLYQNNTSVVPQRINWITKRDALQCVKKSHNKQQFLSDLCDGMWTLKLQRKGSFFSLYLVLNAMPNGIEKLQASWTVHVEIQNKLKTTGKKGCIRRWTWSKSYRHEFLKTPSAWGSPSVISENRIKDCESLILTAEIFPQSGSTIHHWNRFLQKKGDTEDRIQGRVETTMSNSAVSKKEISEIVNQLKPLMECTSKIQSVLNAVNSKLAQNDGATISKIDALTQHILSINNQLTSVQLRSSLENQQSQSDLILSQIAKLTENITSLKRAPHDIGIGSTNEVKIWMERIVKLPQYYNVLKEQGFEDMESVQEMTMEDLREMGIDMIGHRRKIMKKVRELGDGQVIAKDIEIHRARDSMQKIMECILPQRDESAISWFHQKSNKLRVEIVAKHRMDALESKNEEDDEYTPLIRKYVEVNDGANPQSQKAVLCIGEGSELSDSVVSSQLDIVEKYKVYDHPRLRLENGTFGLRAKKGIVKGSVIGEYLGKYWIVEDLETLYGTKSYNDINKYAFEELVEVKMPRERIRYYQRSERMEGDQEHEGDERTEDEDIDMDSNHNMREPPRKKQRKNEEEHTFNIVLDGVSMEQKGILCFMNDCRQDMECQKPSKDDKKHFNIQFVTAFHRGWPRIFGVAVKDIAAGDELLSFYGDYSDVLNQDRKLQIMSNKLRTILAPHGLENLVNQMT